MLAGVIVLAKPSHSLATLAVICGLFMLVDGIFELLRAPFTEHGGTAALLGVLGIVVGILLIRYPIHGVVAVTLLIGIWFVAAGVIRLALAFTLEHVVWNVAVAVVEVIAGIVLVSSQHIGFAALALLVGISFILNGLALCGVGLMMRRLRRAGPVVAPDGGPTTSP